MASYVDASHRQGGVSPLRDHALISAKPLRRGYGGNREREKSPTHGKGEGAPSEKQSFSRFTPAKPMASPFAPVRSTAPAARPAESAGPLQWYAVKPSRETVGPVGAEVVQAMHKTGVLRGESLVWNTTMTEWTTLESSGLLVDAAATGKAAVAAVAPDGKAAPAPAAEGTTPAEEGTTPATEVSAASEAVPAASSGFGAVTGFFTSLFGGHTPDRPEQEGPPEAAASAAPAAAAIDEPRDLERDLVRRQHENLDRSAMMNACLFFFAFAGGALGFQVPMVARPRAAMEHIKMDAASAATACLEDGCSLDTVEDLIAELKAESDELSKRQQVLLVAIGRLQALGETPAKAEANKSEIEKLVGAASRSFVAMKNLEEAYDFPGEALGYSLKPTKGNKL